MIENTPLIIGHRGAPGYRPEHSRASYELAIAMGADAVEPDVVVSRDGVLVVRHENEISGTTDVADHPEFAYLRTTKTIDGEELTGWFTEDFTWDQLATLRCKERLPALRPGSAEFDGQEPILRLDEVLDIVRGAARAESRRLGVVIEIKHATYFASIGLAQAPLVAPLLADFQAFVADVTVFIESFEETVLHELKEREVDARFVYLLEDEGRPFDRLSVEGDAAPTYREQFTPRGLDLLADRVDGVSLDKRSILQPDRWGNARGDGAVVREAQSRGLLVFTWTCRPENAFLIRQFRTGRKANFGDYTREWELIRTAGVDGVFVDHTDLGVTAFRRVP